VASKDALGHCKCSRESLIKQHVRAVKGRLWMTLKDVVFLVIDLFTVDIDRYSLLKYVYEQCFLSSRNDST